MKTTVEIPDERYRQAKAEAALSGRRVRDLIGEGLRLVLQRKASRRPSLAALMKGARDDRLEGFRSRVESKASHVLWLH